MRFNLIHASKLSRLQIRDLYSEAVRQNVADLVFYDGGIKSARDFEIFIRETSCWLVKCEMFGRGPVGFWWLNGYQGRTAQMHYCPWNMTFDETLALGRESLRWLYSLGHFHSVYGVTPKPYRHVFPLIEAMGFDILGEIPGACYLERKDKFVAAKASVCNLKEHYA